MRIPSLLAAACLFLGAYAPASFADQNNATIAVEYKLAGLIPWGFEGVRVFRDGRVVAFRGTADERALASLSSEHAVSLNREVDLAQPNELVDITPNVDDCPTDVPDETYSTYRDGYALVFAHNQPDCHQFVLRHFEYRAQRLKEILRGLYQAANLGWE